MITITENDALLLVLATYYQWTKRSLYGEYKEILKKLEMAGPIKIRVYYPDDHVEDKEFESISALLDWKQGIPTYSVKIIDGVIVVTIRKES